MRPSSNTVHSLEGSSWDQGMIIGEEQQNHHHHHHHHPSGTSTSTAYPLSGVPPPGGPHAKSTPSQFSSYGSTAAQSSSRTTLPGTMYMSNVPQSTQNFPHAADRPLGEAAYGGAGGSAAGGGSGGGNYAAVRDPREDQQQRFPYSQPSYSAAEGSTHLSQHSSSTALHYTTTQQQRDPSSPAQTPVPFAHRRSITDPQGFSSLVNQYPHLPPPSGLRRLSPPRLAESSHSVRPSFNGGGS